jgi:glycosyltransferase involved in cell wall biosynthesis
MSTTVNVEQIKFPHSATTEPVVRRYHTPHVTIVIPHYNYSEFIGDALLSVQQQTYTNFTCIAVDDSSTDEHFAVVSQEVAKLSDSRFKLVRNSENVGQIPSVYRGIDESDAAFVAVLDPDDRYAPEFLERMMKVHLNPLIFCPLVCCDQHLLRIGDGILTGSMRGSSLELLATGGVDAQDEMSRKFGFHRFVAPIETGWHWTSTSSMMFRTDALKLIRPTRKLQYKGHADDYFANGAHMMGGTILLQQPLVYRGLHQSNDFISNSIFSMFQRQANPNANFRSDLAKRDALQAFLANGGLELFSLGNIQSVIHAQFSGPEFASLLAEVPSVAQILTPKD